MTSIIRWKTRIISEVDASIDKSLNSPYNSMDSVDDMTIQKRAEAEVRDQQKKTVDPIINQLDKDLGDADKSIDQSKDNFEEAGESISDLDKQMKQVNDLIRNLGQSIL